METKAIEVKNYFHNTPVRKHKPMGKKNKAKKSINPISVVLSALIVSLAASMPIMSIWFANQSEVRLKEALLPASAFIVAGILLFIALLLITRRPFFSGVYSAFASFLFADFQIVRKIISLAIKSSVEPYISAFFGLAILASVFILLYKLTKETWLSYVIRIGAITLAGIMVLSFIMGNPAIASAPEEPVVLSQQPAAPTAQPDPTPTPSPTPVPTVSSTPAPTPITVDGIAYAIPELENVKLPNVYCFVLDEYGPPEITEKYYGFDNSLFVEFLKERKFNRSSTSLCNIAETSWCTGELHRLDPFIKKVSASKARSYRKNSAALYTAFRDLGYTTFSNSAWPKLFPADQLKNNMDALVDLSTLDRTPPLMEDPNKAAETPANTPIPTATPASTATPVPTPRRDMYQDFDNLEFETDWRDDFFTGSTEGGQTMYDLAIKISVLSLFVEVMPEMEQLDDDEYMPQTEEELVPTAAPPSSSPVPDNSDTPSSTAGIEDYVEGYEDDYGEDYENVNQGETAPLNPDAASDPASYNELVPIPKHLSVHARDMYGVLSRLDQLQAKGFAQPTFLINYIRQPHVPFMFDKYGNKLPSDVKYWWKNPNYYLGQLKFITTHLMHIVDILLETDPDCVIIIQSDHGLRYRQLVFDTPVPRDKKDQYYILSFVYYRGQILDIEGLSPINTYRTVLTSLGLDMPLVEDPRAFEFRGQKYGIPDDDPRLTNINNNTN